MTSRFSRIVLGLLIAAVLSVGAAAALIDSDDDHTASPSTTAASSTSSSSVPGSTTTARATTTTEPPVVWPAVAGDAVARAVRTPGGIVLAVREVRADGSYLAVSPCGNDVVVSGEAIAGAHVVLDPGHGGEEPGAVGPGGTTEKAVNLAIAQEAKRRLETLGATVGRSEG